MLKLFLYIFFTDCGNNETIAHGQVDFTNADTTYGQSVPVTCDTGYELVGGHTIVCLADGQWSKTVRCDIKGEVLLWHCWESCDRKCIRGESKKFVDFLNNFYN